MSDRAILIGFEFIIFSAFPVAAGALLLAEWFLPALFPLAVAVLIGAVIIDVHLFGRAVKREAEEDWGK
jgi:membrane protein implicated in regulation of membrane protease activity